MNVPKTAIFGASGLIGNALLSKHRQWHENCVGTSRNSSNEDLKVFDLLSCDISSLELSKSEHRNAIITAGIAKIYICQKEPQYSNDITRGTLRLIQQLTDEGIRPIYISSDYLFDGKDGNYTDDAKAQPLNEYGKQKAEIEYGIKEICGENYLIARFSKVFTLEKGDGTIFDEMALALTSGKTITAAHDQVFSPTLLSDAVNALTVLQENNATGVFNISSPEVWSRYDLAMRMAEYLDIDIKAIEKISLDDLDEIFDRPKNTSMNIEKLIKETNYTFTPIKECMETIAKRWIAYNAA